MSLSRLDNREDGQYFTNVNKFKENGNFKANTIETVFNFAYEMSFGKIGEHRDHRSGGTHKRKKGEVFANTFQGKLAECAVYNTLYRHCEIKAPDFSSYGLGEWDNYDFEIGKKKISVKSTKKFGELLLLETKDWNNNGQYIPNISKGTADYDYFILIRIEPYCEDLLKKLKSLYSNECNKEKLYREISTKVWKYNVAGFTTKQDLIYAIKNRHILNKGEMLNGKTEMDASNYYIQSGDMKSIEEFIKLLK